MAYTDEEVEALIELQSFMLNDVTEPAMRLIKTIFADSCPFLHNLEYAVYHKTFQIIKDDNHTLHPLDPKVIDDFGRSCDKSILAFPVNCFEDNEADEWPIQEEKGGFGHANLVIVNRLLRTVEHFDPHGAKMNQLTKREQKEFETAVSGLFLRGPWVDFRYYPPREVCPTTGVQNLLIKHGQETRIQNTCRIWCYQFLTERLANPDQTAAEINRRNLSQLQADNPVAFGRHIDQFIIDFIQKLYRAMQVTFEHRTEQVCLRWPQETRATSCVSKKKLGRRRKSGKKS